MWNRSLTRTISSIPRRSSAASTATRLDSVLSLRPTARSARRGTPFRPRKRVPARASVKRSPSSLPPATTTSGATPSAYRVRACSRRARKTREGVPWNCAVPITTMAPARARSSCLPTYSVTPMRPSVQRTGVRMSPGRTILRRQPPGAGRRRGIDLTRETIATRRRGGKTHHRQSDHAVPAERSGEIDMRTASDRRRSRAHGLCPRATLSGVKWDCETRLLRPAYDSAPASQPVA